ncbi:MAG: adenylate/guanylate cyclase domain-containing protein [Sandaracinaceae bacterium]
MDEGTRFWQAVEAGQTPDGEPSVRALGEGLVALMRYDVEVADGALARVAGLPEAWRPAQTFAAVQRRTVSPHREALVEGAATLTSALGRVPRTDPSWARLAHLRAALALRLADASGAESWASVALLALTEASSRRRSWALDTLATAYARSGAWEEARATYAAAEALKRADGDTLGVAIGAGSWGRMELDLGAPARAVAIASSADDASLPSLTRVRLKTLELEARVRAGEAAPAVSTELAGLLDGVDDTHHLAGYASLALARRVHAAGEDPAALLERAGRSLHLPLGAALRSYWARRMQPGSTSDRDWLASLSPAFDTLGVCTLPEVLATLHVASREEQAEANPMLDALSARVAQSNNPLFFRWLDEAGERVDPRAASQRRMQRYLGPQAGALEATARVEATVVFSDLVGFTRRSVELSPEAVMDTVRSVFELAMPLLLTHRLEPLQYLGDGLLALAVGEDHEARGLAFAEALCQRMHRVSAVRASYRGDAALHRMNVRCGVASGPVVRGPIGNLLRTEHLAIGLTTNRAARLQSYAEPDEVICDAALSERGERFEVSPKGLDTFAARRIALDC